MSRQNLTAAETNFLARPLLCKFASISADGSPHLTPIWYIYENGKFILTTPENTVKARNVRKDQRVALLIDDGETYVMIRGNARVAGGKFAEFNTKRLAFRYESHMNARKKAAELLKEKHVTIEVTPRNVVSQGL
jgi:PPOX class probable F420-dependent enzyme